MNQEIAARDFRMAKFYDKTKHYGSAKVYYAEVLKKYPNTDMAQEARERVAQIAGEPDDPPKRLAWFVDLFPESRERADWREYRSYRTAARGWPRRRRRAPAQAEVPQNQRP